MLQAQRFISTGFYPARCRTSRFRIDRVFAGSVQDRDLFVLFKTNCELDDACFRESNFGKISMPTVLRVGSYRFFFYAGDEDISIENLIFGKPSTESQASLKRWLDDRTENAGDDRTREQS